MSWMVTFTVPLLLLSLSKCLFNAYHLGLTLGVCEMVFEYTPPAFWELKLSHLPPSHPQTFVNGQKNEQKKNPLIIQEANQSKGPTQEWMFSGVFPECGEDSKPVVGLYHRKEGKYFSSFCSDVPIRHSFLKLSAINWGHNESQKLSGFIKTAMIYYLL